MPDENTASSSTGVMMEFWTPIPAWLQPSVAAGGTVSQALALQGLSYFGVAAGLWLVLSAGHSSPPARGGG